MFNREPWVDAGYILENDGYYYVMQPKNVWAILAVKDRPLPEVLSDDEDMQRDGVDDEQHGGGGVMVGWSMRGRETRETERPRPSIARRAPPRVRR